MRVGLQVVIGKLMEVIAFVAAGAPAIKATRVDVTTAIFQARELGPLGLDNLLLTSAFHGNRVLRK